MRMLKLTFALIAVLGWAASADAGTVKKVYDVSTAYGATAKTYVASFTFTASTINGSVKAAVYTPASTFTSHWSNPPVTAWMHMQGSGTISAMAKISFLGFKISKTVMIHVQGGTQCHVASHNAASDTFIPASCHVAGLHVTTMAHCTGHGILSGARCKGGFGTPGCFTGASDTHTQMWKAKSVHCDRIAFTHTISSAHFLKSCNAKLVPPNGHTCMSGSGPHLASSDSGFHVLHVAGKLRSTP